MKSKDDESYLHGWKQASFTIERFKKTREEVEGYLDAIRKLKPQMAQEEFWNAGRIDACLIALEKPS